MELLNGFMCCCQFSRQFGLSSTRKMSTFFFLSLLLGQHVASLSFSDRLSKMLQQESSQHGNRMPRWNPDPETKLRVRRALANSTLATDNGNTRDAPENSAPESSDGCPSHLKYGFEEFYLAAYKGPVCDIVDARNTADQLEDLRNCVIVNGFVQLVFMHDLTKEDLEKYQFPKLRVITDYLLVFRVYNLVSLRKMFPNLAVIGGRQLFRDYSLVIYENPNLKEVGLGNLQFIKRGGVRIQKNPFLCYLSTINWERLGQGGDVKNNDLPSKVHILGNREESQCVNQCGDNAGCDKDGSQELCWGMGLCQKRLCPKECPDSCREGGSCDCHEQCLAGCTRPNDPSACIACRNTYSKGTCRADCPPGRYLIFDWLCIEKEECQRFDWHFYKNECRRDCPPGYKPEISNCMSTCVKCTSECGRVCDGDVSITNVESLDGVKECTEITGVLTINIKGGSEVVSHLDEDLMNLKQIGALMVVRSFPLITLSFLKNVRRITGRSMEGVYSVYILENQNLKELWNFNESKTVIERGKAFFHFNPQLCHQEIEKIEKLTPEQEDDKDISTSTNGDKAICVLEPIKVLETQIYQEPLVKIRWEHFVVKDERTLIGYQVYYKESPLKNAKKNEGVDACRLNSWNVVDKAKPDDYGDFYNAMLLNATGNLTTVPEPGNVTKLLSHLKAYTQYAFYIQAYTTSTAESGAASEIQYFKTKPARPGQPRNLRTTGTTTSSIALKWDPPLNPNGVITHYIIEWRRQEEEDLPSVRAVDTCKHEFNNGIRPPQPTKPKDEEDSKETVSVKPAVDEKECTCDKDHLSTDDRIKAQESSEFENYLQDRVFFTVTPDLEEYLDDYEDGVLNDDYEPGNYDYSFFNDTRRRRSIAERSYGFVNISTIVNSTTATPRWVTGRVSSSTISVENQTTDVPKDSSFMKMRKVVNGTNFTLTGLYHYSEYSIQVYACNHASDPLSMEDDSNYKLKDDVPLRGMYGAQPFSKYVKCSIEAMTMKRTSPNKSADVIPQESVNVVVANEGTAEELTTLYWGMPEEPNAYIRTFTIKIFSEETEKEMTFCAHVNSSIQDVMSFNFSQTRLTPGKYLAKIRAISLAGNGNWTEPVSFTATDPMESSQQTIIIVTVVVAIILFLVIAMLAVYIRTRKKRPDLHGLYTDYNPEYQRYVYTADEYEVDIEKVTILEEIGHGNFGKVFAGIAKSVVKGEEETKVAIKKLHENAMLARRYEFLKEASMMKAFNAHHVVRLLGVISKTPDPMVIMEFMEKGDLKSYLRSRRENSEDNPLHLPPPTLQEKLQMAAEIADGMAYLAAFKFVHRDLAARNCLVNNSGTVKIGDFGLARDIYEMDYYRKESRGFLPIRWMAPESLKDGIFDSRSDIWSYGVVLWELATLAEQPYQGLPHDEVTRFVIDGGYMEKPRNCPKRLYDLMTCCWQFNPKMRPTFLEIVQELLRDVDDEFKEVCFYTKNDQTSHIEEEEGQYLPPHEHSDGTDTNNFSSLTHPNDHYQDNHVFPAFTGSMGSRSNGLPRQNSVKSGLLSTPPKANSEDPWLLSPGQSLAMRNIESPNTTSTTAPATPTLGEGQPTARIRTSSESVYENDPLLNKTRDPNLSDSGAFINMGPNLNGERDPLVSYKHLNGGLKHSADLDLDHESGVDDSSTVSPSNPSTPTEMQPMTMFGGHGDETTAFLRPTASSNC